MKKLFTTLFIVISISCFSQQRQADSTLNNTRDTIPLLTLRDINDLDAYLQTIFPISQANTYRAIEQWIADRIAQRYRELMKQSKKK